MNNKIALIVSLLFVTNVGYCKVSEHALDVSNSATVMHKNVPECMIPMIKSVANSLCDGKVDKKILKSCLKELGLHYPNDDLLDRVASRIEGYLQVNYKETEGVVVEYIYKIVRKSVRDTLETLQWYNEQRV